VILWISVSKLSYKNVKDDKCTLPERQHLEKIEKNYSNKWQTVLNRVSKVCNRHAKGKQLVITYQAKVGQALSRSTPLGERSKCRSL